MAQDVGPKVELAFVANAQNQRINQKVDSKYLDTQEYVNGLMKEVSKRKEKYNEIEELKEERCYMKAINPKVESPNPDKKPWDNNLSKKQRDLLEKQRLQTPLKKVVRKKNPSIKEGVDECPFARLTQDATRREKLIKENIDYNAHYISTKKPKPKRKYEKNEKPFRLSPKHASPRTPTKRESPNYGSSPTFKERFNIDLQQASPEFKIVEVDEADSKDEIQKPGFKLVEVDSDDDLERAEAE